MIEKDGNVWIAVGGTINKKFLKEQIDNSIYKKYKESDGFYIDIYGKNVDTSDISNIANNDYYALTITRLIVK